MTGVDEFVACRYGVDLVQAGGPVAAFLSLSEDGLRRTLGEDGMLARQGLAHDSFAWWVRTGADSASPLGRAREGSRPVMRCRNMPGPTRWGEPSPYGGQQRLVVIAGHASVGGAKQTHAAGQALEADVVGVSVVGRNEYRAAASRCEKAGRPLQLPVGGDRGPAADRAWWRLRIEPHPGDFGCAGCRTPTSG